MCVSTIGSYSTFGKKMKSVVNHQSNLVFVVFSHFRCLCLFEEFIEDTISPLGWGTMFQVLKVLEGTGRPAGEILLHLLRYDGVPISPKGLCIFKFGNTF